MVTIMFHMIRVYIHSTRGIAIDCALLKQPVTMKQCPLMDTYIHLPSTSLWQVGKVAQMIGMRFGHRCEDIDVREVEERCRRWGTEERG
jgi:hypothetical protein